jgi:hypothetical protein
MHFHPALSHRLGLARHHDAEHAAARARRASEALPTRPDRRTSVLPPLEGGRPTFGPQGGCAEAACA